MLASVRSGDEREGRTCMGEQKKRRFLKPVIFIIIAVIVVAVFLVVTGQFGVPADKIELDARKHQNINEEWLTVDSVGENLAAMLFYDPMLDEYSVAIYENPKDRPFGYYSVYGGCVNVENEGVVEYTLEGCDERAYISMNHQMASNVEISDSQGTRNTVLDSSKPFALVVKKDAAATFYDADGNEIRTIPQTIS